MRPKLGQRGKAGFRGNLGLNSLPVAGLLAFLPVPALAAMPDALTLQNGNAVVLSALACGGVALAIAAGLWALAEQRAARRLRKSLRSVGAKTKAALGERDALLGAGREALVVWGRDGSGPFSYGGGEEVLQSCLKGADALALSGALDGLSDRGAGFRFPCRTRMAASWRRAAGQWAAWRPSGWKSGRPRPSRVPITRRS